MHRILRPHHSRINPHSDRIILHQVIIHSLPIALGTTVVMGDGRPCIVVLLGSFAITNFEIFTLVIQYMTEKMSQELCSKTRKIWSLPWAGRVTLH